MTRRTTEKKGSSLRPAVLCRLAFIKHNKQQLFVNLNFDIRLFPVLGVSLSFGCLFLNVEVVILESQDADSDSVLHPNEGGGATSVPRMRSFV